MSCEKTAQVQAYYDGELSPAERAAMVAHLQQCAECRDELSDLKELSELVAAAPMAAMSADAMARLQNNFTRLRDRGVMRIASWLTAAAAAILVGALLLGRQVQNDYAHVGTWQTAAVMPPPEDPSTGGELVAVAQWMASDLAPDQQPQELGR
jgi:anti-sigma factor RsiW